MEKAYVEVDRCIDRLIDYQTDRQIDWLIDWYYPFIIHLFVYVSVYLFFHVVYLLIQKQVDLLYLFLPCPQTDIRGTTSPYHHRVAMTHQAVLRDKWQTAMEDLFVSLVKPRLWSDYILSKGIYTSKAGAQKWSQQ